MEGAHRSSRGWVSFLLSPPPSSLASLCPRNKSAPAVVPKRQMRTCDCLAYSGGLNPAPLPFSCPGNPARREPLGPPSRCLSQEPKHSCLLRPLLAEAKRGRGGLLNGGRRWQRVCRRPPRSQALKSFGASKGHQQQSLRPATRASRAGPAPQDVKASQRRSLYVKIWLLKIGSVDQHKPV